MSNPRPAPAEAPQSANNTHLTLKAHVFTLMAFGQLGTAHKTEPNMGPVLMEIINQSPQFAKQCIYTAGEWPESGSLSCHRREHRLRHTRCHTHVLTCTHSPALTCLRFSPVHMGFPGHLSTSLCAHRLLLTLKSQGELFRSNKSCLLLK